MKIRNKALELEVEQIISVASHDLRSPLVNIQGFSNELLYLAEDLEQAIAQLDSDLEIKEELEVVVEGELKSAVNYIKDNSMKLDRLLTGIIKLSRLSRSKIDYKEVDVQALLEEIIKDYQYQIKRDRIEVEIDDMPSCLGDHIYLKEVFSNLIDNAVKYLKSDEPGIIRVSADEREKQVIYSVYDNGIGIKSDYQQQIFNIFNRLDINEKKSEGLGLTLTKKIVEMHGGQIWVESKPEEFSQFFVSLPSVE